MEVWSGTLPVFHIVRNIVIASEVNNFITKMQQRKLFAHQIFVLHFLFIYKYMFQLNILKVITMKM